MTNHRRARIYDYNPVQAAEITATGTGPTVPIQFSRPCLPTLKQEPPIGQLWSHEVKFDGWRIQLIKNGDDVRLFSKNGHDMTRRFAPIALAARELRFKAVAIDGEVVVSDADGRPDFAALQGGGQHADLCFWAFDLLFLDTDRRHLPLDTRRNSLARIMKTMPPSLRYSESFADPNLLLAAAGDMKLEGIVSKRRDMPYRSGVRPEWIKIKTASWREANQERFKLFQKKSR